MHRRTLKERERYAQLFKDHKGYIQSLVRQFSREESEDLTQEIWERVWKSLHLFRGECHEKTWLYTIARSVCSNRHAYNKMKMRDGDTRSWADLPMEEFKNSDDDSEHSALATQASPEEEAGAAEQERIFNNLLKEMPEKYSQTIAAYMRYDNYEVTAEVVGVNLGTVRSRLHRVRGLLREALNG